MKKLGLAVFILLLAASFNMKDALASVRQYVWTEEYRTLPKGEPEVESWVTFNVPNSKFTANNTIEFRQELEYGITDRLNLAHYEMFERRNQHGLDDAGAPLKDSTRYTGYKFEGKYRILDKGKLPVDVLLYFEIKDEVLEHRHPVVLEEKIILSRDFKKLNFTYNQIQENELGKDGRGEPEYAFGTKYELFPSFYAGCELFGNYWEPGTHRNEISIGPTLAWENQFFWIAGGVAFGANNAADDFQARVIVGVEF